MDPAAYRRALSIASGLVAALLLIASPATAQDSGCSIGFNGVAVERIDSLNSPLELDTQDVLLFGGTDSSATRSAIVRIFIGPVVVDSGTTTYATPAEEFSASINLDDVSPYGVGLFRVEGETDGCRGGAWVRVSGRFPLATLTGLTAVGLAVGGVTGQLGAIASRRRWARSAAAVGGIATGTGLALIGQEFGRLQISYPSVGASIGAAALFGLLLATFLNPAIRDQRRAARAEARRDHAPSPPPRRSRPTTVEPTAPAAPVLTAVPKAEPEPVPERGPENRPLRQSREAYGEARGERGLPLSPPPAEGGEPEPEPEPEPTRPTLVDASRVSTPTPATEPYWCYVLAPTDLFDLTDHTQTAATLQPGTWYLAKRIVGGWAHVVASAGVEGWVAEASIHRQD